MTSETIPPTSSWATEVGFEDLTALLARWGPCAGCPADLDGNGEVAFTDLTAMLGAWGACN